MFESLSWDRLAKLGVFRRPGLWRIWRAFGGSDGILDGGGVDFDVLDMWGFTPIRYVGSYKKKRKGRGFLEK